MNKPALICCGLVICLCVAACVPARTPPQLVYTPGPAVQVVDGWYDSGVFRVRYPANWEVITSAAGAPLSVIFAAPEGDALIMVGENLADVPALAGFEGELRSERRDLTLADGRIVTAVLNAAQENWTARLALFEAVITSFSESSP